jgi:hypothetical protein
MSMTNDEISEFQFYLQMYDKGLLSKKTVLGKIDIVWEDEKKEIEEDRKYDEKIWVETMKQRKRDMGDAGGEVV